MFKITVDEDKCIGCGACVSTCPSMFTVEGGKAKVSKKAVKDAGCANEASDICPVGAIIVGKA